VIWGGYAWGNIGDELCLAAALERAQREFGDRVAVLSPRPDHTARLFPDAHVVACLPAGPPAPGSWEAFRASVRHHLMVMGRNYFGRADIFAPATAWMRCVYQAEQLYLAGGGYLSDIFLLDPCLRPVQLAVDLGVPVVTAPLGLGPFTNPACADKVVRLLSSAELQVRDPVSLAYCQKRGLKATLAPDDAFGLINNWAAKSAPATTGRPPKIGVCIFPQSGRPGNRDFSAWWIACLRGLKEEFPQFAIEGFCFHTAPNEEAAEMTRLFPLAGLSPNQMRTPDTDFRRATLALREYDFIIATRFHAVTAANVFQIPNVAIAAGEYYTVKMRAAASAHPDLCQVVDPDKLSPTAFLELCRKQIGGLLPSAMAGAER
jgi:polysaccharide pyruvyl transferase WcaK-like protein